MTIEVPLDRMQRWMQAVVVHPGTAEEAVASAAAQAEIPLADVPAVILPSGTLSATERVAIYHRMYPLRMRDALEIDYPALSHFLGGKAFYALVRAYVQAHPSRSYTLNRLGDQLPAFIQSAPGLKRRDFCHDLARLELAVTEVFDGPATPELSEAEIAAVAPEAWERAVLRPVEAFRMLSFRYNVNAYLQSVRDEDHDHPRPRLKASFVAVYRRGYSVYRLELSRPAHDLLKDLVSGKPLGEAVMASLRRGGRGAPGEEQLFRWFREWVSGGVFRSVEV